MIDRHTADYTVHIVADYPIGGDMPTFDDVAAAVTDAIFTTQDRELPGWGIVAVAGRSCLYESLTIPGLGHEHGAFDHLDYEDAGLLGGAGSQEERDAEFEAAGSHE